MLFGLVDFVLIALSPEFMHPANRLGSLSQPAVVHVLRAANGLRVLRTCRLFKGRWDGFCGGRFQIVFMRFHIFHNQILPPAVSHAWQATCQPASSMQLALDTMSAAVGVKKVKSMTNSI